MSEIDKIMCRIEAKIRANPRVNLYNEPESKALDAALCKTFGFKSAHVYWACNPDVSESNPFTIPMRRTFTMNNEALKYGNFKKKGFYDKSHTMVVFVQMDNNLVSVCDMTGAEMTAVLLHELGHNFDYTPFACISFIFNMLVNLINILMTGKYSQLIQVITTPLLVGSDTGRKYYMEFNNLLDQIGKELPPVGTLMYAFNWTKGMLVKIFTLIMSPILFTSAIPMRFMMLPLNYMMNFFTRKSETYADSFAAAYGYGSEQVQALNKLEEGMMTVKNIDEGPAVVFYNIALTAQEIVAFAMGGMDPHSSAAFVCSIVSSVLSMILILTQPQEKPAPRSSRGWRLLTTIFLALIKIIIGL